MKELGAGTGVRRGGVPSWHGPVMWQPLVGRGGRRGRWRRGRWRRGRWRHGRWRHGRWRRTRGYRGRGDLGRGRRDPHRARAARPLNSAVRRRRRCGRRVTRGHASCRDAALPLVQRSMDRESGAGGLPVAHRHRIIAAARTGARRYEHPCHGGQHQPDRGPADPVRHILIVHAFIPRRTSQCCQNGTVLRTSQVLPPLCASGPHEGNHPEEDKTFRAARASERKGPRGPFLSVLVGRSRGNRMPVLSPPPAGLPADRS